MFRIALLSCFILMLTACNYWPAPSTGGYAAHYLFNTKQFTCGNGPGSICQVQKDRLTKLLFELDMIRNAHAVRCRPARYRNLRLLGQQIAQEIAATLYLSAQIDLNLFEVNLRELKQLTTIKGCPKIKTNKGWDTLKLRIQ